MSTNKFNHQNTNIKNDASKWDTFVEWLFTKNDYPMYRGNDPTHIIDQLKFIGNGISEKIIPKSDNWNTYGDSIKLSNKFKPTISWLPISTIYK